MHLTRDEVIDLTGRQTGPAMARWCDANGYPYVMGGPPPAFPQILRSYHLRRLQHPEPIATSFEPNYDFD